MNRLYALLVSGATFALAPAAFVSAADAFKPQGTPFQESLNNIVDFTNDVLIPFIVGIGFLVFVWGMFQYFIAGGANDEAKEKGKSLMIYATLGFVLIIVFWGVVNLIADSTGLEGDAGPASFPKVDNQIK